MLIHNILFILTTLTISVISSSLNNSTCELQECPNVKTPLSLMRKRRALSFPKGGNVVLTISLVKAIVVHAPSGWNLALEIDVNFQLPDQQFTSRLHRKKMKHREKRHFWEKLQDALEYHNLNGRACVVRGVCEGRYRLAERGRSLVHDLLRAIFSVPYEDEAESELFLQEMDPHYHPLREPAFCDTFPADTECPISILDFVLSLNKQK